MKKRLFHLTYGEIEDILSRLRHHFGFVHDKELGRYLGLGPGAFSQWKKRGNVDFMLLMEKYEGSLDYLFGRKPKESAIEEKLDRVLKILDRK